MTPKDFIRSITPGMMQPQEWGLDLYRTVTMDVRIINRLTNELLIHIMDYSLN